jgi:serine/arginine repetitive matrix protein 2
MYNGVGLLTPRGSGTSGYVQSNKFNLKFTPAPRPGTGAPPDLKAGPKQIQPDRSILEHKAKREIELAVAEEQAKLEDEG